MVSKLSLPLNKLHTVDIVGCDTALPAKSLFPETFPYVDVKYVNPATLRV